MFQVRCVRQARCWLLGVTILLGSGQPGLAQFDFGNFGGAADSPEQVTVQAQFTPATDARPALVWVTADIVENFHVYAIDQGKSSDGGGPMPTQITLDPKIAQLGPWRPTTAPHTHIDEVAWVGLELREHAGKVTWFAPVELAAGVDLDRMEISGEISCQACDEFSCNPFEGPFTAKLGQGYPLPSGTRFPKQARPPKKSGAASPAQTTPAATTPAATTPTTTTPAITSPTVTSPTVTSPTVTAALPASSSQLPNAAAAHLYDLSQVRLGLSEEGSLVYYLITAFFGGVVLNVMPCVLPVIGLKVMSFVQQAGQSRAHAWALNVWYSAGIVFVFLVLAGLAVTLQLGWGGQFGSDGFNITLIGIVFAMSLSLLGMWEIPIPGFVGTGAALEVTEREGPVAAFLKGILTTLLATPCTGPFMATALAWAVKQPAWVTFSVFGVLGLGMASPYLLIGAFPELVRFLPKPGAWMESFKKVMGLILLATVVWLLTFIESPLVVPTVGLMVGIAAACWWISQTPITAPLHEKAYGWVTALLVVVIAVMGSYGWLYRDVMQPRFEKKVAKFAEQRIGEQRLRIARDLRSAQSPQQLQALIGELTSQAAEGNNQGWQSFSLAKLGQLTLGEKRTVLVDFTADWCLTCKTLEKLVLKTQPVEEALTLGEVVTMEADYTKRPEPIDRTIKALGGAGVPLIAIFPAGDPYHPIVFSDGQYTKQALIEAIAQATGRKDLLKGKAQAALSAEDPVLR